MKEESQKKQKSKKSHDCSASVHAEIIIEENINKVWEVLRVFKLSSINFCFFFFFTDKNNQHLFIHKDFKRYKEWNTFTVEIHLDDNYEINKKFKMEVVLDPSKKSETRTEILYKIDDINKELCWGVDWSIFLKSKR